MMRDVCPESVGFAAPFFRSLVSPSALYAAVE